MTLTKDEKFALLQDLKVIDNNRRIVERLKDRIEDLDSWKGIRKEWHDRTIEELQKILGEEKLPSTSGEIYEDISKQPKGEDNVKLTKMVCYHQHTRQIKDGIFCEDCQTLVQTYVLGKKRFGERDD